MRRRDFLLVTAGGMLAAGPLRAASPAKTPPAVAPDPFADTSNGAFGADLSGSDFVGVQKGLNPEFHKGTSLEALNAASSTATRVVLDNLPTVAAQGVPGSVGNPGSCEAESFGYCLGAYTAARRPNGDRKWSAGDAGNQPSAAWLYRWQHLAGSSKVCPAGSQAVPYARQLVTAGAPSTALYPYNPDDAATPASVCTEINRIANTDPGPDAARLLVGSYKGYTGTKGQQAQYLDTFKSLLRSGHAVAFSGLVPKQYATAHPQMTEGAYDAPMGFITGSGHGQVIVGFDDSIGPGGAFLVQNSFGPGWNAGATDDPGYNGRIWYSYRAWFAGQSLALIMYPNNDDPPAGAKLAPTLTDAPDLFVKESRRYRQDGNSYLALIIHAKDAVTLSKIVVTGPKGVAATQTLNEAMRFGYAYVERKPEFEAGRYMASLTGKTSAGKAVTYSGPFEVP